MLARAAGETLHVWGTRDAETVDVRELQGDDIVDDDDVGGRT